MADSIVEAAVKVAEDYDAAVFFYSGPIVGEGFGGLVKAFGDSVNAPQRSKALLILTTGGGSANAGYQIARFLQSTYGQFLLYTPSYCKSAGTLVSLGAHTLIMDTFSELGPLDVQLLKVDEIGSRKSGLLVRSTFESLLEESFSLFEYFMLRIKEQSGDLVSFRTASDIAAGIVSGVMAPVYGQINPDTIGGDYRDLQVAKEYGARLARQSKNPKPDAIDKLVSGYPSHDFVIDALEATELFRRVEVPKASIYQLISLLGEAPYREAPSPLTVRLDWNPEVEEHDNEQAPSEQAPNVDASEPIIIDEAGDKPVAAPSKPSRKSNPKAEPGIGDAS